MWTEQQVNDEVQAKFGSEFGPWKVAPEQDHNYKGEIYNTGCYLIHFWQKDLIIRMGPLFETFSIRRLGYFNDQQVKELMKSALTIRGVE